MKLRRNELKLTYRAPWIVILVAVMATILGMLGNVVIDYKNLLFFLQYFIPTVLLVLLMYLRIPILKAVLQLLNNLMSSFLVWRTQIVDKICHYRAAGDPVYQGCRLEKATCCL